MSNTGTRWTSELERVCIDTGEYLTKHNAERNYIHIKTIKNVTLNKLRTKGTIIWTRLYRQNPQRRIFE